MSTSDSKTDKNQEAKDAQPSAKLDDYSWLNPVTGAIETQDYSDYEV